MLYYSSTLRWKIMAKLSEETLTTIFDLMRQLAVGIDEASAAEWELFEQYGETPETLEELEELQSARERLRVPYSALHSLLLSVLEYQPMAPNATLELLARTIENGQTAIEVAAASVRDVKRNWNLSWQRKKSQMPKPEGAASNVCGKATDS